MSSDSDDAASPARACLRRPARARRSSRRSYQGALMSNPANRTTPRRFRRLPKGGPLRLVMPCVGIAAGAAMAVKGAVELQAHGDSLSLWLGLGLVVAGVVAFFVNR